MTPNNGIAVCEKCGEDIYLNVDHVCNPNTVARSLSVAPVEGLLGLARDRDYSPPPPAENEKITYEH